MSMIGTTILTALVLMFAVLPTVEAQDAQPRESMTIHIESEPRGAEVYRGDSLLGLTPLQISAAGADTMAMYYPSRAVWNPQRRLLVPPFVRSDQGVVLVRFLREYTITSHPGAAAIFLGDSVLGYTPTTIRLPALPVDLRAEKPGCSSFSFTVTTETPDTMSVLLHPILACGLAASYQDAPRLNRAVIPATVGIVSGALAILFKQKADRLYDSYLTGGDPGALKDARRYDLYAGIALAVLEFGFAYFASLLFLRD
jgi:hypothetical protein